MILSIVLFYMPYTSKSVKITYMPLAEELAKRGHQVKKLILESSKLFKQFMFDQVTVITPFKSPKEVKNLREIIVEVR